MNRELRFIREIKIRCSYNASSSNVFLDSLINYTHSENKKKKKKKKKKRITCSF